MLTITLPLAARDYPKAFESLSDDKTPDQIIEELRAENEDLRRRLDYYTQRGESNPNLDPESALESSEEDHALFRLREEIQDTVDHMTWPEISSKFNDERNWQYYSLLEAKLYATFLIQRCHREKISTNPLWTQFI